MKVDSITLTNFRSYKEPTTIFLDQLTALVGKNDIGKSTILEALDIFINDKSSIIKKEDFDLNIIAKKEGVPNFELSVTFTDLPANIVLDTETSTTLSSEHLLNSQNKLEIIKQYKKGGKTSIYIKAVHPTNPKCNDLLLKKNSELKKIIQDEKIEGSNKSVNSSMRAAIWDKYKDDLQLKETLIDASKEDAKNIYEKLTSHFPIYSLFQSDRKNSDNDSEVQDPLKEAVKQILSNEELKSKLADISERVREELEKVSKSTLEKLRELDPAVANSLNPVIPSSDTLKWPDVFKSVSISGDDDIPINKRGSGVKRLVLLSFFRAQAERHIPNEKTLNHIIYAIEEPETSQHNANQKLLIESIKKLSQNSNIQIIITTHSPIIVKQLNLHNIRLITNNNGTKNITIPSESISPRPSLNEINYLAYEEPSEEYHNELYGLIEHHKLLEEFRKGKPTREYIRSYNRDGTKKIWHLTVTEYIRHQIHHPENTYNEHYSHISKDILKTSIEDMREFLRNQSMNHSLID